MLMVNPSNDKALVEEAVALNAWLDEEANESFKHIVSVVGHGLVVDCRTADGHFHRVSAGSCEELQPMLSHLMRRRP